MSGRQPLRRHRASRATFLLMALLGAIVVGCARPVAIQAPDPEDDTARLCGRFIESLPDELPTVGGRRTVSDDSGLTAAYGDPPVAIRCGVPDPPAFAPTSTLVTVQDVDWLPEELSAGWRLTTIGLAANVELTVPTQQGPAPSVAVDVQPSLRATIPVAVDAANS